VNGRAGARRRAEAPGRQLQRPTPDAALEPADGAFDRLIYGRVRLGILSALAVNQPLTFNDLKMLFGVTDGNLSAHARKLEDAGYITCRKTFEARRPRSEYRLTGTGRKALNRYLSHIEAVIKAMRRD
jgi:DNA-binding MarR family transcriptional regulator